MTIVTAVAALQLLCAALPAAAASSSSAPPVRAAADPPPAAVLLPLRAAPGVTAKQARGVSALLRKALDVGGFARALSASRDDERQAERCRKDLECLARVAAQRGADLLVAGEVAPDPAGLRVSVWAVPPDDAGGARRLDGTLEGGSTDAAQVDRLMRRALNPSALRGAVRVDTDARGESATVSIDGQAAGTLPLAAAIDDLVEGSHILVVEKDGYETLRRPVEVVHGETAVVKVLLLPTRATNGAAAGHRGGAGRLEADVLVAAGMGAGLLALGSVAGALSWRESLGIEERARAQQLTFPADSDLMLRGQVLSWAANGLYVAGAAALGLAALLWMQAPPDDDTGHLGVVGSTSLDEAAP